MVYLEKLKNPKWQQKRLRILERDHWTCQLCDDKETELHVHHKKYTGEPWEALDEELLTYCKHCHFVTETLKGLGVDVSIIKINKYITGSDTTVLLVVFLKKIPDTASVCFVTYSEATQDIDQVVSMKPFVIRETNTQLDKLKEEFNKNIS